MKYVLNTMVTGALYTGVPSGAASGVGLDLRRQYAAVVDRLTSAATFGREAARNEIIDCAVECNAPNWDGYGARAVEDAAVEDALDVLASIPLNIPAPSIGVEADGMLTFEWYTNTENLVSVSIGTDGFLHYAGLLGVSNRHGTEPFGGVFPRPILDAIRQVQFA